MAKTTELLNAVKVKNAAKGKLHADGGSLYLKVTDTGSRSWVFRYKRNGKLRDMGLGNADVDKVGVVTLAQARRLAGTARQKLLDGIDPLDERKKAEAAEQEAKEADEPKASITFKSFAKEYVRTHAKDWKNSKHRDQWDYTLDEFVFPIIGHLHPAEITKAEVLRVLKQDVPVLKGRQRTKEMGSFWDYRTETATRVLSRIRAIMTAAKALQLCAGDNPADGLVEGKLITAKPKSKRVVHRPALPWEQIPELMELLGASTSISARALELAILCACRPGEVLNATFEEFDLDHKDGPVWVIPAVRMKASKEHRIPLASRAVEIVKEMQDIKMCAYAFPGLRSGRPLSDMAMTQLMRGMPLTAAYTAHGTARSAFRDWASNRTTFPDPIIEVALAHVNDDKTREAYARSDLFDLRRLLMPHGRRSALARRPGTGSG